MYAEAKLREDNALLETCLIEPTAELLRCEAQLRLITDSIRALIGYINRDRRYRYINRGFHNCFGLNTADPDTASAKAYLGVTTYAGIRHIVSRALAGAATTLEYETTVKGARQLIARTTLIPEIAIGGTVAGCFELDFYITKQRSW